MAEVSHKSLVFNPLGWSDGILIDRKIIYNALFTEHSGNLLSSIFFSPSENLFGLRTEDNLIKEILTNQKKNHLNFLLVFSKMESNAHLNDLFKLDMFNPFFDPIYNYELPDIKNYFANLENLIDFPKIQTSQSRKKVTFNTINKQEIGRVIEFKDFANLYLNLFEFKNIIVKPGISSTRFSTST